MRALLGLGFVAMLVGCTGDPEPSGPPPAEVDVDVEVVMRTSLGSVTLGLFGADAPVTAANFLAYVDEGFYDGTDGLGATHFHRVIDAFMVQGGGYLVDGTRKETRDPIENEAIVSGLTNARGTLAMARTSDPDSATSQFFINVVDNDFLDPAGGDAGYAVFGRVTAGMDVVDAMAAVPTTSEEPDEAVVIESMGRVD